MKIHSIFDIAFKPYGKVLNGYDTESLIETIEKSTPLPEGVMYVPSEAELEKLPVMNQLQDNAYGGMPIQLGWCNGYNTKLNCLEYHRDSELNLGTTDFILLLAEQHEMYNGILDTDCVKAFLCPANTLIEVYATALHYAPCSAKNGQGFKVMVVLPRGTNTEKPKIQPLNEEDGYLWARNKWLLAHPESDEANQGAYIGLKGQNIDIQEFI